MNNEVEKIVYGYNLTVLSFSGTGKIPVIYGGMILNTEASETLMSENNFGLEMEQTITSINIKVENADSTNYTIYTFPLETGQVLGGNDYIDENGLHIGGETIAFTSEQETAYDALQEIPLYEGISHIIVIDEFPATIKLSYFSIEKDDSRIYVLNKNEQLIAVFERDDDNTLINPKIEKKQNSESTFTFTIDLNNPKWNEIRDPENLYLVDGMIFSTNFDGSFKENLSEDDAKTVEVTAYERQQLLSRKYVRAWNSETNLEKIDTFMVVILSNGTLPLKNDGTEITTTYPKGSSGYALEGLLYGTGWTVGTCDIYEYENGNLVTDENNNPVYAKFDLETDQLDIYENILKIQELWGGILVFDSMNKVVHHRNETNYLPYSGYEVKYQKNMQSLEKKYNNKIITKLCPLGEGGLNIKSVNNNSVWLENYDYTSTPLEGIENNPDITDPKQLKIWGQRKLEMMCRPSIELDVKVALLYQLDGYELETLDLNHIVDVVGYEDVDLTSLEANGTYPKNDIYPGSAIYPIAHSYLKLRVIEFSYSVWNKTDASIKLSNITLDSTDIFRQAVISTNSISAGTLDAAKVTTLYRGGESVEQTMSNLDGKVDYSYNILIREDTGIIARLTRIENEYDSLSGTVNTHTQYIGEWDLTSGDIASVVSEIKQSIGEWNISSGSIATVISTIEQYIGDWDITSGSITSVISAMESDISNAVQKTGDTMTGSITMNNTSDYAAIRKTREISGTNYQLTLGLGGNASSRIELVGANDTVLGSMEVRNGGVYNGISGNKFVEEKSSIDFGNWHSVVLTRSDNNYIYMMLYGTDSLKTGTYSIQGQFQVETYGTTQSTLTIPSTAVEYIWRRDWGFELGLKRSAITGIASSQYNGIAVPRGGTLVLQAT